MLGLLNLVLCYGIIRRLREYDAVLATIPRGGEQLRPGLPVGATPDAFVATTTMGAQLGRDGLVGDWVVGFFAPGCPACHAQLSAFVKRVAGLDNVIAVVQDGTEATTIVNRLTERAPAAHVVLADVANRGIVEAFDVQGFPVFFAVADGVVRAVDPEASALPAGVAG